MLLDKSLLMDTAKGGPFEKRGTVAARVVLHDGTRMVRHMLRVSPAARPLVTLQSFALDSGEGWTEPLAWESLSDPDINPFIQRAALGLLPAVEADYGISCHESDELAPAGARLIPGKLAGGKRTVETQAALDKGILLSCMIRSHLSDTQVRDDTGTGLSYLVAVRMLLPERKGSEGGEASAEHHPDDDHDGRESRAPGEPSVQEAIAASYEGSDPSASAPGDAKLPRFRILVSRLTQGQDKASGFASLEAKAAPSRCSLQRTKQFPSSFMVPFQHPTHLPKSFTPEEAARFPVSTSGDGLLTGDVGMGKDKADAFAGRRWRPGTLGPGGVDLDTCWRTLPYSRSNDRRLNLALEVVEANRFKPPSEEAERVALAGREHMRKMRDDWDSYLVETEKGASAHAMGIGRRRRIDARTGKAY